MSLKLVAAGAPCLCSAGRVVRHVVPRVPGIPHGEVSCRPVGSSRHAEVRYHKLAADATVAILVPGPARP